jgi:cytochrome c-type protein NapB
MKIKKSWIGLLSLVAIVAVGCASGAGNTISEESLGLRKTDLYSEDKVAPSETKYTTAAPGTSKRFERAYENAPPMIPHSVDGLLPITKNNNACLGCHMPDVAPSMGATPIPPSHFVNFRPKTKVGKSGEVIKEGKVVNNTSDVKVVMHKQDKLYQGRYNCSQCHAPQAEVKPLVKNNFTPDFRKADAKKKSNLLDTLNEGVDVQ